jgi:hypothetical protein
LYQIFTLVSNDSDINLRITSNLRECVNIELQNNYVARWGIDRLAVCVQVYVYAILINGFFREIRKCLMSGSMSNDKQAEFMQKINYFERIWWDVKDIDSDAGEALKNELYKVVYIWSLKDLYQVYNRLVCYREPLTDEMLQIIKRYEAKFEGRNEITMFDVLKMELMNLLTDIYKTY